MDGKTSRVLIIKMHAQTKSPRQTRQEPTGFCFREEGSLDVFVEGVTSAAVCLLWKLALEVI